MLGKDEYGMLEESHGDKDGDWEYEGGDYDEDEEGPTGYIFMEFMFPNGNPQAKKFKSWLF